MGIQVEYNPDLALRNISEHKKGSRTLEECIPGDLKVNETYKFLKKGQRNYWLLGELPLLETKGNQDLSLPKASIVILEATHFIKDNEVYTKGEYKVMEIFDKDKVYFNGFAKVKE
jgi:hypothetical protein|tara:strand:- start:2330 stop:2677 length:348 start_codon:yes stop_codon:yes gene_type:complete